MILTSNKIAGAKPAEKRVTLRDGNGLFVRIHPSGIKSWVVRIKRSGVTTDFTLGHWPEVSLKMARQLARRKRLEFNLKPPKGFTFRDAFLLWCCKKRKSIKSYRDERRRLVRYVLSKIGNRQLDTISAPLLIQTVKELETANRLPTLKRVLMRVREIFDLAVFAGYIEHNPCIGITKIFPTKEVEHMPAINWKDLPILLEKLFSVGTPKQINQCLISLCLLLRPGEVAKLRWDWIESDILTIPAKEMKMRRQHRVPLSPFVLNLLAEAKRLSKRKRSPYIFPGSRSPHVSSQSLTKFFLHKMNMNQTPHGFRSIGRSFMADQNFSTEASESCLAHVCGNAVTRSYQRSDFLEQRKTIMNAWSDYVRWCAECATKQVR